MRLFWLLATSILIATCDDEVDCYSLRKWAARLKGGKHYRDADEVLPGIWIGNVCAASSNEWITENGITHVLNMAAEWNRFPSMEKIDEYVKMDLHDSTRENNRQTLLEFDKAADLLMKWKNAGDARILVHCNAGVSRSSSTVIAFLIKYENMSFEKAFALVEQERPVVNPNYFVQTPFVHPSSQV